MFKRILVPLDGSPRAERALKVAANVARASHGTIILLQVVGIPAEYSTYMYEPYVVPNPGLAQEVLAAEQSKAETYIEVARQSDALAGVNVEANVVIGGASVTIQDLASAEHIDLIVMCSYGETGFKRWLAGSVAQSVVRASEVPVLVLREDGVAPDSPYPDPLRPLRSIMALVALDGSEFAEAAITPTATLVASLAAPAQGTLLLTRVVPLSSLGNTDVTKELAMDEARSYLSQALQKYADVAEKLNVSLTSTVAIGKDVADTLIRAAEQGDEGESKRLIGNCDLIAITTHGHGWLQRLVMGSVTDDMLGATNLPLLVVHAPE